MSLTVPNPTLGTGIADSTKIDDNFSAVSTKFGNIDNSDIASNAGIAISKLAASYEYMVVPLTVKAGGFATTGIKAAVPITDDGKGNWTVAALTATCTDTGNGNGRFIVQWGRWAVGVGVPSTWTVDVAVTGTMSIISNGAPTADTAWQWSVAISNATLTQNANFPCLALNVTTAEATCIDVATNADAFFTVAALLKRQIAT